MHIIQLKQLSSDYYSTIYAQYLDIKAKQFVVIHLTAAFQKNTLYNKTVQIILCLHI